MENYCSETGLYKLTMAIFFSNIILGLISIFILPSLVCYIDRSIYLLLILFMIYQEDNQNNFLLIYIMVNNILD